MKAQSYLNGSIKNGNIMRWSINPLTVYIAPMKFYSKVGEDAKFRQMVIEALNAWSTASGGKIGFRITNVLLESNINVDWKRVDRQALGHCYFNWDAQGRLYGAEVSIGLTDGRIHKQYDSDIEVYHTILHEIGHALGLGHSNNPGDIMYTPHQYGVTNLSQRDIDTVRWLYSLPFGTSVNSLNATYSTSYGNIDDIILHIASGEAESTFQRTMNGIQHSPKRNLEEDQQKLAQMGRFNIAIQNIRLPKEITDKFKDM